MRKYIVTIFATVLLLVGSAAAQTKVILDVPMKSVGAMPAVEVMVNGQGPFLFAIDTGASGQGRVDSSLVAKLSLPVIGQASAGDSSGRNAQTLDLVEIGSIKFGGMEFKNVEAASRDYKAIAGNRPQFDGILGFGLFADYLLTLDFPAKRVRLSSGELVKTNDTNLLPFDVPRGIAVVEISVGEQKVKAHFDSGNMVAPFVLPTDVVEKASKAGEAVVVGRARTVSNDIEIKRVQIKDTIRIGTLEFKEPQVSFPALSAANIGAALMQDLVLTFDQKKKLLNVIQPPKAPTASAGPVKASGEFGGVYGERTISEESDGIYIQRTGGPKLKMVKQEKDEFTLEQIPNARIRFLRSAEGKVNAVEVLNPAGQWERSPRDVDVAEHGPKKATVGKAGIQFVLIPAGEFVMGSDSSADDQRPAHKVSISKPFYLAKYEVTVGQFRSFVEATKYVTDAEKQGWGNVWTGTEFKQTKASWREPGFTQTDQHPVVMVSYNDAVAFATWAGGRLPTEAEWEYVARARGPGELTGDINEVAWSKSNLTASDRTKPVGEKKPNAWGLFDMFGNAWERVSDWYSKTYYAESAPRDPKGPETAELKVNRGGGWFSNSRKDWPTFRGWGGPNTRDPVLGFRVAMDAKPS